MTSRGLRAALIGLLAGAAWAQPGADAQAATAEAGPERPNIVVILSDDEDLVSHAFMPKTKALIEEQGAAFDHYFVTYSFCCPSRATMLRGQSAPNHRIQGHVLPTGGALKFRPLGPHRPPTPTSLQPA